MATVTLGQWSPLGQTIVDILEIDGAKALQMELTALWPPFGLPVISTIVGWACSGISKILIGSIDRLVYAGFVAIRVNKQVNDYVKADASGDKSSEDSAADKLIHLGDV